VAMATGLAAVAECPSMKRAYERTIHKCCRTMVQQVTGKLETTYCRGRWCAQCSAMRTAATIARYGPEVAAWGPDKWFVTLTRPNVKAAHLKAAVKEMVAEWRVITRWLQRKYGNGAVKAIRSLETTYNAQRDDTHPHFHVLINREEIARDLLERWLVRFPAARRVAQDVRRADDRSWPELLKYAVKATTERDGEPVPPAALDKIFTATRGLRLLGAVGIRAFRDEPTPEEFEAAGDTMSPKQVDEPTEWCWVQSLRDWVAPTGETLSDYVPCRRVEQFIQRLEQPPP
jgi:hypothetical protein